MALNLLLVEDDANVRAGLKLNLEDAGYVVDAQPTYKAGLAASQKNAYDIVLTDTQLLDSNFGVTIFYGTELCRQLRRKGFKGVIIGMSMHTHMSIMGSEEKKDLAQVYLQNGADAFIEKNKMKKGLERTIQEALAARQG